jgi:hypothetical protein
LPAIRDDGAMVVALLSREMGGRGADGLSMVMLDTAADREAEEFVLRGPTPDGVRVHAGGAAAALDLLAGHWEGIAPAELKPDSGAPRHHAPEEDPAVAVVAGAAGAVIRYREPTVDVLVGSRVVLSKRVAAWSAPPRGKTCAAPWAAIDAAWVDVSRRTALLRIAYHGPSSDLCWLPDPTLHVVRWP